MTSNLELSTSQMKTDLRQVRQSIQSNLETLDHYETCMKSEADKGHVEKAEWFAFQYRNTRNELQINRQIERELVVNLKARGITA